MTSEPGYNARRLEVDRTREELESTLAQIEDRLDPRRAVEFGRRQWEERPIAVVLGGLAVIGGIALLVVKGVTRG